MYFVNADVPMRLVTLHSAFCKDGQPQEKLQRDGGWREFETISAALNWMISWNVTSNLKPYFCHVCNPMGQEESNPHHIGK